MMQSPFGQYAPIVASFVAVLVIAAYIVAQFMHLDPTSVANLGSLALLAAGAIFGSALAVNGWKVPLSAAHTRLDKLTTAVVTNAAAVGNTEAVSTILNDGNPPTVVEEVSPGS